MEIQTLDFNAMKKCMQLCSPNGESIIVDTKEERNALMQHVYPQLAEFCREKHGLEFQVQSNRKLTLYRISIAAFIQLPL